MWELSQENIILNCKNMKTLRLEELEVDKYYYCPMLQAKVLVTSNEKRQMDNLGKHYDWREVTIVYWNNVKGYYETYHAHHGQLMEWDS
jgi:hypothetical protein